MSELNRENIIKALECCMSGCPLYEQEDCECVNDDTALLKYALALIKELTEKVENYRNELGEVRVALAEANNDKKTLLEEIEELEKTNEYYSELEQGCYVTGVKNVTADTVRKMQERLKAEAITIQDHTGKLGLVVLVNDIDKIAKEMLEG